MFLFSRWSTTISKMIPKLLTSRSRIHPMSLGEFVIMLTQNCVALCHHLHRLNWPKDLHRIWWKRLKMRSKWVLILFIRGWQSLQIVSYYLPEILDRFEETFLSKQYYDLIALAGHLVFKDAKKHFSLFRLLWIFNCADSRVLIESFELLI